MLPPNPSPGEQTMPRYFITKYALSAGIEEFDLPEPGPEGYIHHVQREPSYRHHFYRPGDWHSSHEEAVTAAEKKRQKKITSLTKQIAKLEKKTFGVTP